MHVKLCIEIDSVDYICLVTQKGASEEIMDLDIEEIMSDKKIIDLDTEVSAEKTIVSLTKHDIMILLQIVMLGSNIWYFGTIIFLLIPCLVNIIFKDKYSLILYYKFWQLY